MRVILDWVANHTAWDNPLVEQHPDWYERDWDGDFRPTPWWDWSDIIDLDYRQPGVRRYMTEAMQYWVREADVDGFRCDVAWYLPLEFWEHVRAELDAIKPVFMLAEAEFRDLHAASFDATYAWSWHDALHRIGHGRGTVTDLFRYYSANESAWPRDALRMTFVSNHDKNSWEGTQFELMGDALENAIALSVIGEGIPMVYNGQEAGNRKRLEFFEKDAIEWRDHEVGALYTRLLALRKAHSPLWNGAWGARMEPVVNDAPERVLTFVRRNAEDAVFGLFNFSGEARRARLLDGPFAGAWRDALSGEEFDLERDSVVALEPWSFRVLLRREN
ncbi:MAG: alpha-amylase family glycosyl hydrolase, partial [Gammaproteobacteria bacterium]